MCDVLRRQREDERRSNAALADALGHADAILKGTEAESKSLKDEFKRRGLLAVSGENFAVTATEQISGRLDSKGGEGISRRLLQPV